MAGYTLTIEYDNGVTFSLSNTDSHITFRELVDMFKEFAVASGFQRSTVESYINDSSSSE